MLILDAITFFEDFGIPYIATTDPKQVKITCPLCHGYNKVWVRLDSNAYFCHKCHWTPDGEQFVAELSGVFGFEADLLYRKYLCAPETKDFSKFVLSFFAHGASKVAISRILDWPDYYYSIETSHVQDIAQYAVQRTRKSLDWLKEMQFGACVSGELAGYLIMPVLENGRMVFWQGRDAWNKYKRLRYRTPKGFSANNFLFNIDGASEVARASGTELLICEGIFSAIKAGPTAVATFGNKISMAQIEKLRNAGIRRVCLCFDPDTWRVPTAIAERNPNAPPPIVHAVSRLLGRFDSLRVAFLERGDPDELSRWEFVDTINRAVLVYTLADLIPFIMAAQNRTNE